MRIITVVCCTLLASALLCAQSDSVWDGSWWNSAPAAVRLGFVIGWSEARYETVADMCDNGDTSRSGQAQFNACVQKTYKALSIPANYTYGQFEDGMDRLYADYRNRLIPLQFIAEEVEKQINGESDQQIETGLEAYRKAVQQTQSQ